MATKIGINATKNLWIMPLNVLANGPCSPPMNTSLRVKLRLGKQMEHRFSKIPSALSESV